MKNMFFPPTQFAGNENITGLETIFGTDVPEGLPYVFLVSVHSSSVCKTAPTKTHLCTVVLVAAKTTCQSSCSHTPVLRPILTRELAGLSSCMFQLSMSMSIIMHVKALSNIHPKEGIGRPVLSLLASAIPVGWSIAD